MKFIKNEHIDKGKWDDVITNSSNGNIFNLSWYLDAVCDHWDALIDGDYETLMPIPVVKKGGVDIVFQPFFARQLGVFSKNSMEGFPQAYLKYLCGNYKKIDVGFDKISDVPDEFFVRERRYQVLKLDKSVEELRKNYSNNAKRLLKKTPVTLTIKNVENTGILVEHFSNLADEKGIRLAEDSANKLGNLMQACQLNNAGKSYLAYDGEELAGGAFFMLFRDRVILLKNFTTKKGKETGVMYKLIDQVIYEHQTNFKLLDFGGSDVKSVAGFNKKFGSTDAFYLFLSLDRSPLYFKLIRSIRNKFRKH